MIRKLVLALAGCLVVVPIVAQLSDDARLWGEGPVTLLMTDQERAAWVTIESDREAGGFVELFWARRDPTPETPANEFREEFLRRIQYADQNFALSGKKGSETERGRVFMLLGPPSRIQRPAPPGVGGQASPGEEIWIYEGDKVPSFVERRSFQIRFEDQYGSGDFQLGRSLGVNVNSLLESAVESILIDPDMNELPTRGPVSVPVAMQPAESEVVPVSFEAKALADAIESFRQDGPGSLDLLALHYDEAITADGQYFVPLQLWLEDGAAIEDVLVFFGLVENEAGDVVRVWEQRAILTPEGDDGWFDHSLIIEPGTHRGIFGLARGTDVIAITETKLELGGIDKDGSSTSKLILSKKIEPLAEAQQPTDPFAFGGLKVVPQGNRTFTSNDELWYFIEIRNPGLKEEVTSVPIEPGAETPAMASEAGESVSESADQGFEERVVLTPAMQIKLDLEGEDSEGKAVKMSAPSMPAQPLELKGVPGHYATGSSIPLESFKPGEYTLKVRLFDSVLKKTWNYEESFRVRSEE